MSRRIKELKIEYTLRGFPYFILYDKGGSKVRVQQSSTNLDDILLVIEEQAFGDNSLVLSPDNLKDIQTFANWCKPR